MVPYRVIAENAINNWQLAYGEKDAKTLASEEEIEGLEAGIDGEMYGVGGKPSIVSGTREIVEHLKRLGIELPENATEEFLSDVMTGKDSKDSQIFTLLGEKINQIPDIEELVYNSLVGTHDDWTERSSDEKTFQKKISRNQLHQYNPLEVIGWKEATADLLFIEPILKACGVDIDIEKLHQKYDEHVMSFLEENGISSQEDLKTFVLRGQYEALQRTESGREFYEQLKENPELLDQMVANITGEKGMGSVEQFISEHSKTLTPLEIENATTQSVGKSGMDVQIENIKEVFSPEQQKSTEDKGIEQ